MAETPPTQKLQRLANEAGFAGAVSLYGHLGAIHWLGVPAPDNSVLMVLIPAGATVTAGLGRGAAWAYRTFIRKETFNAHQS